MPYLIKLTKAQKKQFIKEIMDELKTLDGDELKEASKFLDEMSEKEKKSVLTHDEYLVTAKAKICQDEYCKKIIHEVMQKNQLEYDLELSITEFLKSKELPKTNPDERIETLKIGQEQILQLERVKLTEAEGLDPSPIILGYAEDGEPVLEQYKICDMCKKVFKTFKNENFCQPSCREQWVKEKMPDAPLQQEIFAERNSESWNWERVGNGKFKRVWKND